MKSYWMTNIELELIDIYQKTKLYFIMLTGIGLGLICLGTSLIVLHFKELTLIAKVFLIACYFSTIIITILSILTVISCSHKIKNIIKTVKLRPINE